MATSTNKREVNQELSDRVKEYFLNNDIEMAELARRSKEIFGQKISYDTLGHMSDIDPEGNWFVLRQKSKKKDRTFQEEIETVREVVFNTLTAPDTPANAIASLTKAWMELSKSTDQGRSISAKTSPERAIELANKALQQLSELDDDESPEPD